MLKRKQKLELIIRKDQPHRRDHRSASSKAVPPSSAAAVSQRQVSKSAATLGQQRNASAGYPTERENAKHHRDGSSGAHSSTRTDAVSE